MTCPPNRIANLLTELATCLCAQITEDESPETCFCGVVPGDMAVQDYAGNCAVACGMAWVRVVSLYPATGVNVPSFQVGNCSAGLGLDVEIGITRCITAGDSQGNPPEPADLLAAFEQQMKDALTMQRAVVCCDAIDNKAFSLSSYNPMGPLGGLVGGTWRLGLML